jgi:hypothetical protein
MKKKKKKHTNLTFLDLFRELEGVDGGRVVILGQVHARHGLHVGQMSLHLGSVIVFWSSFFAEHIGNILLKISAIFY